ncbi:hypothetical protein PRK78_002026 [Emydomyces testavorans]|uniref:Uncharacterized protein n=1 Tax=Emydomyces testavorans TaxID=2070801 RepID=A0AAF0IJ90_9EURO|nr:hypothetical protein PRK78_002026 [Emydomyces testavorans]
MSGRMQPAAEALQTSSVNRGLQSSNHGSKSAFTASRDRQDENTLERVPSDTGSLSSGIVDTRRMVKSHHHRHHRATLPPLPDLRFEQSYLASISQAKTWGRVAWITIRDQALYGLLLSAVGDIGIAEHNPAAGRWGSRFGGGGGS